MHSFLVPFIAAVQLLGLSDSAADDAERTATVVAQVSPSATALRTTTDSSVVRLAYLQKAKKQTTIEKQRLRKTYNSQLAEVDRLKRARASWRRDRELREQKARSQKTAVALQKLETKLRSQHAVVVKQRKHLATAIGRELQAGPDSARRAFLSAALKRARASLRKSPRKIQIPDLELDEFADPEELLEQISLIERAEAELARQEKFLSRRADHYSHMDALRSKHVRAGELGAFDDDNVRRTTGRVGSDGRKSASGDQDDGAGALNDSASSPSPSEDPGDIGGNDSGFGGDDSGFAAASIVLADVVDPGTQSALRRAGRSTSPRAKAKVARQAHEQVKARLERLRASKGRIKGHLKRLRRR